MSKTPYRNKLKSILPDRSLANVADTFSEETASELLSLINKPNVSLYVDRTTAPYGLTISTDFGAIHMDHTLQNVDKVYVGGVTFAPTRNDVSVIGDLLGNEPGEFIKANPISRNRGARRGRRVRANNENQVPFEDMQVRAVDDLSKANLTYKTLYLELSDVFDNKQFNIADVMNELVMNEVDEKDIAKFLVEASQYKREIVSQIYGVNYGSGTIDYNFETIQADDSFRGRLMTRLGVTEAEYDAEHGVMKIGDRHITNLPEVDENGIFSNQSTRYIPYKIGYFADEGESRVDRLRYIDPVENAITAVELQYKLTNGDVRFKTILDVSRNLPDFENHPYGQEILETYKRKVVLDKSYTRTNSLIAEHQNRADELGAVALTMLDEDAKGLIDPLGTSNGSNMGVIFYLTEDATFNPDGTLSKGTAEHSPVGNVMKQFNIDNDNFNRHQMSFNAMLTSTDVQKMKVAYTEFAMWNAEDAVVLTDKGADKMGAKTGDKITDMHGNKSVSSLIIDSTMSADEAKAERLEHAVEFAKLNPDLDMVVSPVSLASRLNMGVAMEGLHGEKQDLYLPNGEVVKGGIVEIAYMTLPQTAEHKSKDYGVEGAGRKYSTLFHHALASKIGEDLYRDAIIRDEVRDQHIDEVSSSFDRLGVSFKDDKELLSSGNIQGVVPDRVTVHMDDYSFSTPAVIRMSLVNQMENNSINIDLGDMGVVSPMTGEVIKDESGRNVLPIRVAEGETIPYRYTDVFKQIALGNQAGIQNAYSKAVAIDFNNLTAKDNIIKNIDTMTFFDGAKTEMIAPDPRLRLGQISTSVNADRVLAHRDPCVQSGNVVSMENIGSSEENLTRINPLMVNQVDGDFDSDTMGINSYNNLRISEERKQELFDKSSVYEQLNRYGEVFLSTGGSHFKAAVLVNGLDDSNITFADGKSNAELATIVEDLNAKIVDSQASYGAYALSFENENTLKESLGKLADDGIKGNRNDMIHHFENGYTVEEDRAVMKALIAKSEWTGLAGSTTNKLIAGFGGNEFDPELTRVAMDVTYSMTQSVLQMKKNADKLIEIDDKIARMKVIMDGSFYPEETRSQLLEITDGLAPKEAVNKFVDVVIDRQQQFGYGDQKFGTGVLHSTGASNNAFAFMSETTFTKQINNQIAGVNTGQLSTVERTIEATTLTQDDLTQILNDFDKQQGEAAHGL